MDSKDPDKMWGAIDDAHLKGCEVELQVELLEADKLAATWDRLRRLQLKILDMNNSTLIELKNYKTPLSDVHQVLIAAFLLLGENEEKTGVCWHWSCLKKLHPQMVVIYAYITWVI